MRRGRIAVGPMHYDVTSEAAKPGGCLPSQHQWVRIELLSTLNAHLCGTVIARHCIRLTAVMIVPAVTHNNRSIIQCQ